MIVCQFGAMFFPDKPAAYAEAARVLAPGGTLLLTVWDTVETSDFPAALVASLAAVLPENPPDFVARVPHGYADPDRTAPTSARAAWKRRASSASSCAGPPDQLGRWPKDSAWGHRSASRCRNAARWTV